MFYSTSYSPEKDLDAKKLEFHQKYRTTKEEKEAAAAKAEKELAKNNSQSKSLVQIEGGTTLAEELVENTDEEDANMDQLTYMQKNNYLSNQFLFGDEILPDKFELKKLLAEKYYIKKNKVQIQKI